MNDRIKILGIAGSLRKGSYNRAALRAAQRLAPEDVEIEIFELHGIPPFNQDEEMQPPEKVVQFKKKIRAADAILIVTPEYNYSFPGVLKNAIDWASRPYGDSAWDGKPAAVMGASVAMTGSARAQYHLRQCFIYLNMWPLNRPEVLIANAAERFDEHGNLVHEDTKKHIRGLVEALARWTRQLRKAQDQALTRV